MDDAKLGTRNRAAACPDFQQLDRRNVDRRSAARPVADRIDFEGGGVRGLARIDRTEFRGGPAHVEGDDMGLFRLLADQRTHQHSGGGPGLDDPRRLLGHDGRRDESSCRLHDEHVVLEATLGECHLEALDIAPDDRPHVRVGDRRAGAFVLAELG